MLQVTEEASFNLKEVMKMLQELDSSDVFGQVRPIKYISGGSTLFDILLMDYEHGIPVADTIPDPLYYLEFRQSESRNKEEGVREESDDPSGARLAAACGA